MKYTILEYRYKIVGKEKIKVYKRLHSTNNYLKYLIILFIFKIRGKFYEVINESSVK